MKKILAAILLLSVGCAHPSVVVPFLPPPASSPTSVPDTVAQSIGRFSIVLKQDGAREVGSCTAFSIAPRKFMTAAHCVPKSVEDFWGNSYEVIFKLDNVWATVVKVDEDKDLAVVIADEVKPAVTFRDGQLKPYESVFGIGFGYGLKQYLVTDNKVQALNFVIEEGPEGKQSYPGTLFMGGFIGGMSGGPIADLNGQVVGVVQAGTDQIGYGVDVTAIHEFLNH